jgi:HEAT repeat protein
MKVFVEGRAFITNKEWAKAAEKFRYVINEYPKSENVDVARYWLAFALKKQDKLNEASEALTQLLNQHPNSSWVNDAKQMMVEIAAATGRRDVVIEEAASSEDEIKIIALQSLFEADPARASALVSDILKRGSRSSARLREAAVSLLGHYGGKEAMPALLDLARNEQDIKIRKRAISALGWKNNDEAFNLLKQLAGGEDELAETALLSIVNYGALMPFWSRRPNRASRSRRARLPSPGLAGIRANRCWMNCWRSTTRIRISRLKNRSSPRSAAAVIYWRLRTSITST